MPAPKSLLSLTALTALAALALALAAPASAQTSIAPPDPVQFERISLRQTVDSCAFNPEAVQVTYERGTIVVVQPPRQCLLPGPPEVVDIQLGAFPPGDYRVEIHLSHDQPPIDRVDFTVQGLVQPAVFPPPPAPLAHHGGIWWTPAESGWGMSLHQSRLHMLFGTLYVFGADQQPHWYTLEAGQWLSSTKWSGSIYETHGPAWSAPVWNPAAMAQAAVGSVTIDFTMTPGHEDTAVLEYTIGGTAVSKVISRIRF